MDQHGSDYRRGRSGRPYARLKGLLKREGSHICWICGTPIDLRLTQRDGKGQDWTLDHWIPLSIDPSLALDPENAREAHRSCNSSRGNRPHTSGPTSRNW
ncbi:HNH endonuclease [Streptomyces sp. NPDC057686]|uniref:HNH endonuclease n=1 Tax=Streptomyces sp. NPDC057686 TaxID=3346212 RepID=UPI0036786C05